jgi:putative glutamine amidotransferase
MNILVSQRHTQNRHGDWTDSLENAYVAYFEKYGVNLIPVSNASRTVDTVVESAKPSGIILTGGGEVDPELYGASSEGAISVSKSRDTTEANLLEIAVRNRIPVLGICRGMQFINVHFGGSLLQNLSAIDRMSHHATPGIHEITLVQEDLVRLMKGRTRLEVNSYHNQGVVTTTLAKEISAFAVFEELNLVEGLFHPRHPIAAIEWHPERPKPSDELDSILVNAFLQRELFWKS